MEQNSKEVLNKFDFSLSKLCIFLEKFKMQGTRKQFPKHTCVQFCSTETNGDVALKKCPDWTAG